MTPEERVRALGTVDLQASCDCNTCAETRARLIAAFVAAEREAVQESLRFQADTCREQIVRLADETERALILGDHLALKGSNVRGTGDKSLDLYLVDKTALAELHAAVQKWMSYAPLYRATLDAVRAETQEAT